MSLTLASDEVPAVVGLRLFLPESWTSATTRFKRAGVPEHRQTYRTKPEIALAEIDRVRAAGLRFGCVLADAGYGLSAPFRQALSERGLKWVVGIPFKQKVYPADVAMIFPAAAPGRPRQRHVPDRPSITAQAMLDDMPWRMLSWRNGTKGRLRAHFAAVRVRVADGPPQRIGTMGAQHVPGEEAWLIGERRSTGERKYYLSNLPASTPLKQLGHQGPLGVRAGASAAQGRTRPGSLRRTIMDRTAQARLDDHDRLRLLYSSGEGRRSVGLLSGGFGLA